MSDKSYNSRESDVVIIGAGICGLFAARMIKDHGLDVVILEKSRGVGGRMATRRIEQGVFDHGAQFFTIRSSEFESLILPFRDQNVVDIWCHGFSGEPGHPRYRCPAGMTALPKHLNHGLDVRLSHRAECISHSDSGWEIKTNQGSPFHSNAVLLTAPLPQALALLQHSGFETTSTQWTPLCEINYDKCIAVLALLDAPSQIPQPGALQLKGDVIDFIADNQSKGISPVPAVTIHASPGYSDSHYESDDETVISHLLEAAQLWIPSKPVQVNVKRWRYSKPRQNVKDPSFAYPEHPTLMLAGDAFAESRVEGAAQSGLFAAQRLLEQLKG